MSQLAGVVFDSYDDMSGETLRTIIPDSSEIPDFVKEAQRITPEESATLPDDNYALVLLKEGQKFKKYATVDAGNTALSVLYLLKQAHFLPEKAVKVAASNLVEACNRFNLDVPHQLKLAAKTGVSGVSGEAQQPYLRKVLNIQLERSGEFPVPEPSKESTMEPQLGQGDGTDPDVKKRTNHKGVMGSNFLEAPPFTVKERFSNAEGSGIDREKMAAADPATLALLNSSNVETRQQNWRTSPYVDVQDWEPGADIIKEASVPSRTLLRGKFPVDSYDQVKMAEVYFGEYIRRFHPRDRREYCIKLASRMTELSIPVTGAIEKYASEGFGGDVQAYVGYRRGFVHEEFHPALDVLMEKQAMVSPDTFAEALCEFDQMTNLHHEWDARVPDPWASTFGASYEKVAAEEWVWDEQGVRIDEKGLEALARNGRPSVSDAFGDKFADEFSKSPKTFFMALPTPNKLVLARMVMCSDHSGDGEE